MVLEVEELTMNEYLFYGRKKIIQFTQQFGLEMEAKKLKLD